ncbi:BZ3500_MvSof-1268-A1-R1_Chr2-3g05239 [Microbotryum saponariae]|uniref:Selenoprotein O n=1 Tax=Microbotryum saponariae TaxID=289078 RepID=A0A2X0LX35_9BASI|nr:BZ3500_MvSof-1268-A1-R1_Chr2-3g05239 [Microbotryum saponariae]SDA01065.1 BZ3501_MvSof-1269-A2-R1_Chr2-2g04912 [Microbotryum saponariae]
MSGPTSAAPAVAAPSHPTSISRLPISPRAPIYHLPADPLVPTPQALLDFSLYEHPQDFAAGGQIALKVGVDKIPPSMLRRSRMISEGGAFTFVSPLPLEFPYDIQELSEPQQEKQVGKETTARAGTIETALAQFEVSPDYVEDPETRSAFSSKVRQSAKFPTPQFLSISQKCRDEWLPQLDIGEPGSETRKLLVDVLGGKTVLAREGEPGFAPWSLCYGGHQFGSWAGQLGDGRAISILSTPAVEGLPFKSLELQLKGAGRTPYSRFADGLAVLRSSVREYLGAEAVAALKLPTSRALALVGLPSIKVRRETIETAAIVTRVSDSWIRIGNFEIQRTREQWDTLLALSNFVGRQVYDFDDDGKAPTEAGNRSMALAVLTEASRRTAIMVAGWQAYGFQHGVINTDNVAMNGACIDYGPYAFMDVFDSSHICNHSDDLGRYSYKNQPTMGLFAITKLGTALAELIGAESSSTTGGLSGYVQAEKGWGEDESKMEEWRKLGNAKVEAVKTDFVTIFMAEYTRLMRLVSCLMLFLIRRRIRCLIFIEPNLQRLGFSTVGDGDFDLVSSLLDLMELHSLDFHATIRLLSQFPSSNSAPSFSKYVDLILPSDSKLIPTNARVDWTNWFDRYARRLSAEGELSPSERRKAMDGVNPRFVLRQWVLEETIERLAHQDPDLSGLERVLCMSEAPFEAYGEVEVAQDGEGGACKVESDEDRERTRLCGMGKKELLGFQCSCSS